MGIGVNPPPDARLDLRTKLRQRSLAAPVATVREGGALPAPVVVELDVTTFCDLACPECISSGLLNQGRFSSERLARLADELADAGVRAVILIGGGEPLLHPAVGTAIATLVGRGVKLGLTTNGTQIDRHLDEIAGGMEWTRVSVDAATSATYARFRPDRGSRHGTFERVVANMRALAARKRGSLGFSFLLLARRDADGRVTEHNFGEVARAAALAREIGCDYFEVKPEYDMAHYLIAQPDGLLAEAERQIAEATAFATDRFHVIAPTHLADVLAQRRLEQPKAYHTCAVTELRTLVTPSGAYVCPYHRGNPDARYGDPATMPFRAMWSSVERRRARARIDPSVACHFSCIRHASNEAIADPAFALGGEPDYDLFM